MDKWMILPLSLLFVGFHLSYWVQFWAAKHDQDMSKLEQVNQRTPGWRGFKLLPCEEGDWMFSLEDRQQRGPLNANKDFTVAFS